jgi:two-component system sensor histidine kinase KdpD
VATRGVGLLLLSGFRPAPGDMSSLATYANQLALVLERRELRARAMRAELLEEVDKLRGALMGAVSHDLRTPLASITAAASTLRERGDELSRGDRDELVELIESQAQRLARLVSNLLDMTRIASGSLELRKEATGLGALLDDALALLPATVAERVVVSDPDAPLVRVDPLLISQVLANLLENADRHAPSGTPIEVSARRDGDVVEIAVDDSGPGVPEGSRDSIFSMFSSGTGGAGVGLAIARSFVEAHGGTITAGASPSGGARFVMRLPFAVLASEVR